MKNIIFKSILALGATAMLTACEDVFTPAQENLKDISQMYDDANFAQGFLISVYRNIPAYYNNSDYATDDAVTNQTNDSYRNMATGSWTAVNDPMTMWVNSLNSVQNLNLFIENADKVKWADDPEAAELFKCRMMGEAHGLRALYNYYLLRSHAGVGTDGQLYGALMLTDYLTVDTDFNMSRATFDEHVKQILEDLDYAQQHLPMFYENMSLDDQVPAPFNQYTTNPGVYNRVMGEYARQLMNASVVCAIRSRLLLMAASPAFEASATTWAEAADASADVLDAIGGVSGLAANGATYYCNTTEIDKLAEGINPAEILWRGNREENVRSQESDHFPPSLYGNGRMNPTQNLVDAFPMANGYPIDDVRGGYDAARPYTGRDPRLSLYIIYNGSTEGVSNTAINTAIDSSTADGLNKRETSTRTGYYMKKRLRMDVNCNPSNAQGKMHLTPRIRYTEMFLNYAEAANEAWGPKGTGTHAYSAYDVIKAIRKRAGINNETYLDECAASKEAMRKLIRNERRLELCFESFRFWDLRRWKADLNETARGVEIRNGVYTIVNVEERAYEPYMYYGPIPNSEVLKFSNLKQNQGW